MVRQGCTLRYLHCLHVVLKHLSTKVGFVDLRSNFQAQTAWSWLFLPLPWLTLPLLFMFLFFLGTSSGVVDLLWVRVELQAFLQLLAQLSGCPHHACFPMAAGPPADVQLSLSTGRLLGRNPRGFSSPRKALTRLLDFGLK